MLNIVQAVNHTLRDEMRRNGNIVVLGEDIGVDGVMAARFMNSIKQYLEDPKMLLIETD